MLCNNLSNVTYFSRKGAHCLQNNNMVIWYFIFKACFNAMCGIKHKYMSSVMQKSTVATVCWTRESGVDEQYLKHQTGKQPTYFNACSAMRYSTPIIRYACHSNMFFWYAFDDHVKLT